VEETPEGAIMITSLFQLPTVVARLAMESSASRRVASR